MTKVKKTNVLRITGNQREELEEEYNEVGINEMDDMLKKVAEGGNEAELREQLIKKSTW